VRTGARRHFIGRLRFDRVNEIGELDRVLNKEHRHVITDEIEIAFIGIKLGGETAHVAHGIGRAARTLHSRKTHIDGVSFAGSCRKSARVRSACDS
jgi:hypothetical protein